MPNNKPHNSDRGELLQNSFTAPHHASIGFPYCGQLGGSTGSAAERLKEPAGAEILPGTHPPPIPPHPTCIACLKTVILAGALGCEPGWQFVSCVHISLKGILQEKNL